MYVFLLEGHDFLSLALGESFLSVTNYFDLENRLSAIITQRELNILILAFLKKLLQGRSYFRCFLMKGFVLPWNRRK